MLSLSFLDVRLVDDREGFSNYLLPLKPTKRTQNLFNAKKHGSTVETNDDLMKAEKIQKLECVVHLKFPIPQRFSVPRVVVSYRIMSRSDSNCQKLNKNPGILLWTRHTTNDFSTTKRFHLGRVIHY